ncbi:MAG TPA: hypothetical protein VK947_03910 [Planococcus sp. (in: firmicutes)]|nr:hypothetical protein [Planococcus sp. (in: firmicutes)]
MSKRLFLAASILSIGGLLAACGTDEPAQDEPDTTAEDTFEEAEEDAGDDEVPADEATDEETETEGTEDTDESGTEDTEEGEESGSGSDSADAEGTLTASDEQSFELYILPGYALTAEEPNKDSLYLEEDDSVFMRIETFSLEDIDFESAESVTIQTLEAVNADAEVSETTALDESKFVQSSSYAVPSAEGTVTGITLQTEDMIARLTIFDSADVNATEDFIQMGETIQRTGN